MAESDTDIWIIQIILSEVEENIVVEVLDLVNIFFTAFFRTLNTHVHIPQTFSGWNILIDEVLHKLDEALFVYIKFDYTQSNRNFTVTPAFNISLTYVLLELGVLQSNFLRKTVSAI